MTIEEIKADEEKYTQENNLIEYHERLNKVLDLIINMLGFLLVLPEDPRNDPLHLYNGL